jgi:hypothetical protein
MGAVFVLVGLAFTAVAGFMALLTVGLVIKTILRLVLLPLLLIKWLVMGILMLVVGPIVFLAGLFAFAAIALVFAVPLLPFLAVAALIWVLVRSTRRPVTA